MRPERRDVVIAPPQLGFAEEGMDLPVTDGMQQHGLPPAVATGDEVMTLPPAPQGTPAQGA